MSVLQWLSLSYPRNICTLGRLPVVLGACPPQRTYIQRVQPEAAPCLYPRPNSVERVSSEPLPPKQPRVVIPLSQWRRRYDNDTRVLRILSRCQRRRHASGPSLRLQERKKYIFRSLPLRSSRAAAPTRHPSLRSRRLRLQELINFPARREDCSTPGASEVEGTSTREKIWRPAHPVEASSLPDHQQVTISPPSPEQEEGEVTPSDADIPDSIARALLDALQEKRTGSQLPGTLISVARVGAS